MARSLVDVARRRPMLLLALAFVVGGLLFFAVFPADSSVTSDDGAYELTVRALREEGTWSVDYVLADADPTGIGSPFHNAVRSDDGYYPYVRRPAWVIGLTAADAVGGIGGQRVLILLCGAAAIGATGWVARAAGVPFAATAGGVLVALSPLVFDSLQFWAHAASVAAVAVLVWAALTVMDQGPGARALVLGSLGAALGAAVRPEAAIFAAAVAIVCVVSGVRAHRPQIAASGALFVAAAAGTHLASARIANAITGSSPGSTALRARSSGSGSGRLEGLITTVVSVRDETVIGIVLVMVALVLVGYALSIARRGRLREATFLVIAACVVWLVRIVVASDELPPGLLGAWPIVVFVAFEGWSSRTAGERRMVGIVGLATLGVLATQYDNGGGLNWGARFLAPALPLLAVLLAATLHRMRESAPEGRSLALAVLGLAAVTTVASLVGDATLRDGADDLIRPVEAAAPRDVVVTSSTALPRLAWRTYPGVDFVVVPEGDGAVIRRLLEESGIGRIAVYQLRHVDFAAITDLPRDANDPGAVVEVPVAGR